ncbi:MAG: Eco57I restriction-modification methylase domain-containing protein [Anaerolineaceae bacterium]|nr:Eco57I restriction-modification methylase domain-containing protein [Anaerolineaceae bacterium]
MLDDMRVNDEPLDSSSIRQLENADRVAGLFHNLRYDITERTNIPDYTVLGMSGEDMRQLIHKIELIGKDPADGDIVIYLFEVRSVTAKLRNDIARRFRERPENALLVLTKDYQELEFVLLERVVSKSQSRRAALKQAIRPIPLTINRLNPDPIALRVLKRFTFTEEDAAYQWEKLRSAYMLAEWSEEYFNNRALFSDYYLKERLTDEQITPEWREDVKPIGREIFRHLTTARKNYTRQTEAVIRKGLFEPVFKLLGFDYMEGKSDSSGADEADYLLYTPGDQSKPIAAALTYVWNRNLDDVDESRERDEADGGTPFEIPGAMVVSLLEKQTAPWVIVTNGKLWRLYSSTASNKATNYYEIDLEEAIAANDQITALKYWWLMFRRQAFTGFLDNLLKNSADYAKELGDRLKDRVFVEIFPQFAKGFIADMRAQGVQEADIDLDVVFSGTMTFLYRLMFTLYAESLELVPINEVRGYREHSLYRMKYEIAAAGGTVLDQLPDKLKAQYKTNSTNLYARLSELFTVIDAGSDELNMPTYNGGLFSQETDSGQFLAQYGIPDRYLALGLDRLTRDIDQKTQALVFIDFKSLGVRQLGSIYEGLLEFKLKIASEALAVTKEKGKEVYQSVKKLKGKTKTSIVIAVEKDAAYLENDRRERRATGSYYTPDYVVKYIVRNTVGPVLDRKFGDCESRLHKAQKGYREYAKLVEARRKSTGKEESVTVYWNSNEMRQLVDDCLNVRVLDPAMGSGHFLVEVVDYVSNRLIDFLNGWTENPVWAFLEQTRQDILDDMERQRVTIDESRLTRVALLKRAVLKRCVYGVDLNAMAVELAKVSLWLDAFTLGAPLSFLDHHLKHGNSLIGSMDLSDVVAVGSKRWEMILDAAADMVELSKRTDSTIGQVGDSRQDYEDARAKLDDVKKYANVSIAAYFVDTLNKYRKSSRNSGVVGQVAQIAYGTHQGDSLQALFERAQEVAAEKCFFHWKLEFPEVYIDLQQRDWAKDGGFDAVVGNPPYVNAIELNKMLSEYEKPFWKQVYSSASGAYDLYIIFIEAALLQVKTHGYSGLITPNKYLSAPYGADLRRHLYDKYTLVEFYDLSRANPFDDPSVYPIISIVKSDEPLSNYPIRITQVNKRGVLEWEYDKTELALLPEMLWGFLLLNPEEHAVLKRVIDKTQILDEVGEVVASSTAGEADTYNAVVMPRSSTNKKGLKLIDTGTIDRFESLWDLASDEPFLVLDKTKVPERRQEQYSNPKLIFAKLALRIEAVCDTAGEYASRNTNFAFPGKSDLLFLGGVCNSWLMTWIYRGYFGALIMGGGYIQYQAPQLRLLPIKEVPFTSHSSDQRRLIQEIINAYDRANDSIVLAEIDKALDSGRLNLLHDVLVHLAQQMIDLNKQKQAEIKRFLAWLENRLNIKPDNRGRKSADSLSGTTGRAFTDYLGDYQREQSHLLFRHPNSVPGNDFYWFLFKNKNRFNGSLMDVEGEIQREYEKSLAVLIPFKRNLARTDILIDKVVYRLYGLTDAEIELIERSQYEQALTDAKAQAIADETITGDTEEEKTEQVIEKIAEAILPAAQRFFERIEPRDVEATLDGDLPNWRTLPPDAPTFMLTGDYNLRSLPDHMDFSSSVIPYTKAVEVALHKLIFEPFRTSHSDRDCRNEFLQKFMRGEKELTLGSYMIILSSSRETALRGFISRIVSDVEGLATTLNDTAMRDVRNKAAHDEVLSRDEAQQTRTWAMDILRGL